MITQRDLVLRSRHIRTAISSVMNFMITICLLIFVYNVVRHSFPSFFQYGNSVLCFVYICFCTAVFNSLFLFFFSSLMELTLRMCSLARCVVLLVRPTDNAYRLLFIITYAIHMVSFAVTLIFTTNPMNISDIT